MRTLFIAILLSFTTVLPCYAGVDEAATAIGNELEKQASEDPVKGLIWWIAHTFGPNIPTEVSQAVEERCDDVCLQRATLAIIQAKAVLNCTRMLNLDNVNQWGTLVGNPGNASVEVSVSVWDDTDIVHVVTDKVIPAKGYFILDLSNVQVTSYATVAVTSRTVTPLMASLEVFSDAGRVQTAMDCKKIITF